MNNIGPGAYEIPSKWSLKSITTRNPENKESGIMWIKAATAPSIPSVAQSYGYEEGPSMYCL
jgi:hypothetical protein